MNVNFPFPKSKRVKLSTVSAGSVVRFLDSSKGAQSLAEAVVEPDENLFIVFDDKSDKKGYASLVSIDGKLVCRRQSDREVAVHKVLSWEAVSEELKPVSSLEQGAVVLYGIERESFYGGKKSPKEQLAFLFIVTKDAAVSQDTATLISFFGEKVTVDSDRLLWTYKNFSLNLDFGK